MSTHPLVLGLGSTRCVGKDTLASLLQQLDPRFVSYSFAGPLKTDLYPFLWKHFAIDVWDCTPEEKEVIRHVLIGYGMAQRARDPDYWVNRTMTEIKRDLSSAIGIREIAPVLADCRFSNEVRVMRAAFPGFRYVNVTRDGAPPPTAEEEKHYREVAEMADIHFHWGYDHIDRQKERAAELLAQLKATL